MERAHQHELEGRRLQAHGDGVPDRGGVPAGVGAAGAPGRGGGGAAVVEAVPVPPGARAGGRARRLRVRGHLRAGPPRRRRRQAQPQRRPERRRSVPGHAAARAHHPPRRRGRAPPPGPEQPPRLRAPLQRAAGAPGHHRQVRLRERVRLRPLPGRRLRAPGRPDAHGLVTVTAAPAPAAAAAGRRRVARVPPLQRALPVAAQGRPERGQDGGLPAQGAPVRRRHRRQVARQGAPQRGLRQLHPRVHQAREQQEVMRIGCVSDADPDPLHEPKLYLSEPRSVCVCESSADHLVEIQFLGEE